MKEVTFPYGACECDGPTCCGGYGPAAFEVTRDGKRMRLCTRCDLSSDQDKIILINKQDDAKLFFDFDTLGAFCLLEELRDKESTNETPTQPKVRPS